MSVEAITWALKQRVRSATHKAVLLVLANRMDPSGFGWPSQKLVAKEAQCCERTVRKALRDLEDDGVLIRSDRRRRDGSYSTDAVQFAMPLEPAANPAGGDPAADAADGKSCRRQDTTEPAANPAGLTTFEPNTKNPKKVGGSQPPNLPEALASYNEAAERCGWVMVREFTENRRISARAAWKRLGGKDGWHRLIAEAERQSFLGGANDKHWRMDFDWILKPSNAAKVLEGKYLSPGERGSEATPAEIDRRHRLYAHNGTWRDEWGPAPSQAQGAKP